MRPNLGQSLLLFSPAAILLLWAVRVAQEDGYISNTEIAVFLIAMAISVSCAELVRMRLRREKSSRNRVRDKIKRS